MIINIAELWAKKNSINTNSYASIPIINDNLHLLIKVKKSLDSGTISPELIIQIKQLEKSQ